LYRDSWNIPQTRKLLANSSNVVAGGVEALVSPFLPKQLSWGQSKHKKGSGEQMSSDKYADCGGVSRFGNCSVLQRGEEGENGSTALTCEG
ncbi:unnamed protein product, partial [Choristocarpus tenellus]